VGGEGRKTHPGEEKKPGKKQGFHEGRVKERYFLPGRAFSQKKRKSQDGSDVTAEGCPTIGE